MTVAAIPDEAVALFREAPEGFVAARDALAAGMRDNGRADEAATVKALRKPTVVAWALNQLVVRDPDGVQALVDAGAEVRAAQQAALSSKRGAAERLRSAGTTRRGAVADLAAVATQALSDAGRATEPHADAIARALQTCSIDPEAGSALVAGTIERPPADSAGFGDVFGLTSLEGGAAATRARPEPETSGRTKPAPPASKERSNLRIEAARLTRDRDAAARRAKKAHAAADGFAHELEGMRRRLEVVERKHAAAAASAAEGEADLARAERALRRATDRLVDPG